MKFKGQYTGEYDPEKKTLTFAGTTTSGNKSELSLPISDPNRFMIWMAGVFREVGAHEGSLLGSLVTHNIGFGLHPVPGNEGMHAVALHVHVGEMKLSFVLPVRNLSPQDIEQLGSTLQAALAIIERADTGSTQN